MGPVNREAGALDLLSQVYLINVRVIEKEEFHMLIQQKFFESLLCAQLCVRH